ncbi:MAG: APC family permease [Chloroflexi bacterium]|nr:APC family permease [Chloroflexota bacterium]
MTEGAQEPPSPVTPTGESERRIPSLTAAEQRSAPDGALPRWRSTSGADLRRVQRVRGKSPGDQYLRISRHPDFRRIKSGYLVPREGVGEPETALGKAYQGIKRFLFGRPLASAEEPSERVTKFTGLALFASDNISSSAYATEEIMRVLILAGVGALALTMPITLAVCVVLAIVVLSYREVIRAYPNGGGSYVVAHENLGPLAGLVAGAALLTDYILTVSVSTAAGIAAIISAFPELYPYRVGLMVAAVTLVTLINLRGVRESGKAFAIPTYAYVVAVLALIGYGLVRFFTNSLPTYVPPPEWLAAEHGTVEALSLLLLLRAFASGSVALTGTEAVSNGVPAFKPPEVRNAQTVLLAMGALFATIFIGLSFLSSQLGIVPDPTEAQTVVSQLARTLIGEGPYFYFLQFSTALLLLLAANTSFNGFPRLASVMAKDRFLPRIFQFRGDRLAYTSGIVVLAMVASLLIVAFNGSVTNLIPLYTVGVFIAFTCSQAGLVRHWYARRHEERHWRLRIAINGLGAFTTGFVAVEVSVSKFLLGAWMVLVLIPLLIWVMWAIRKHYQELESAHQPETPLDPRLIRPRYVIPIAKLNVPALQAIAFARATAGDGTVTAVHITDDPAAAEQLREQWARAGFDDAELVIIESPFRSLTRPFLAYLDALREAYPTDQVIVVLPEFVPAHWWEHLLHNQTALRLRAALFFEPGIIVTSIPYHLGREGASREAAQAPS